MTKTSTTKFFVIAFNVLCALIALVLIAFGVYVLCSYDTNQPGEATSYAYIAIGTAALVVFVFGCLGALRESVCCTVTFVVLIFLIIIGQSVLAFCLTYFRENAASNLANQVDAAWEQELKSPGAMTIYENWLGCCGRASPQDYIVHERLPPSSCFRKNDSSLAENLISQGCRIPFEDYWMSLLLIFNILSWILIGLEILGAAVSCCLCNSIRNDRRRAYF